MTLEELKSKMKPMKMYSFRSKALDPNEAPEDACALYAGRCRVNNEGELECQIMIENAEWPKKGPGSRCFTIKTDEELEPWIFNIK